MKPVSMLHAGVLLGALALGAVSGDRSPEGARAAGAESFGAAQAGIPVQVLGEKNVSCQARAGFGSPYHGWDRCPFDRVVTGVELRDNRLVLTCSEIQVTCR